MAQINTRLIIRNDSTVNWNAAKDVVLLKGEIGIEFDDKGKVKMKVGDGVATWEQLKYFGGTEGKVFEVSALDEITDTELAEGDIAIVKTLLPGTTDKYSHTAYTWEVNKDTEVGYWAAMDGNYNASNVYFDEDFTFTKAIGTVTIPSSGSTVVDAEGKSLKEFFAGLFAAEQNPSTTQPSAAFNSVTSGAMEVGTKVSPAWNAKLNAGSYTYGPATGVTATAWSVTNTNGGTADTASGTFDEIQVTEATNYKITATATYADGAMPKTNIGNDYPAGQIKAGSKSVTSSAITGYRAWFCGYKAEGATIDVANITSAQVRALGNSANGSFKTSMPATKMQQMFFAAPAGKVTNIAIVDAAKIPQNVLKKTVSVEGANGFNAVTYDLFYVDNATAASGANTYAITVTKA